MKTLKRTEVEDRCVLVTNTLDRNQRGGGNKAKERDLTEDKEQCKSRDKFTVERSLWMDLVGQILSSDRGSENWGSKAK